MLSGNWLIFCALFTPFAEPLVTFSQIFTRAREAHSGEFRKGLRAEHEPSPGGGGLSLCSSRARELRKKDGSTSADLSHLGGPPPPECEATRGSRRTSTRASLKSGEVFTQHAMGSTRGSRNGQNIANQESRPKVQLFEQCVEGRLRWFPGSQRRHRAVDAP
jgi:hypothetical protein